MEDRFPDIDEARHWYGVALDGIRHLKRVTSDAHPMYISDDTADQLFGMTEVQWRIFAELKAEEHETFASLALMAACEGGIRRDCLWRADSRRRPMFSARFRALLLKPGHVSLSCILDAWQSSLGREHFFIRYLQQLRGLYSDRNALAHGRTLLSRPDFSLIYNRVFTIRSKWHQAVEDFRGF